VNRADANRSDVTGSNVDRSSNADRSATSTPNADHSATSRTAQNRETMPRTTTATGEANRSTPAGRTDTQAGNNDVTTGEITAETAGNMNWDRGCYISPTTSSFAFQTSDGRVLHFDSAANSQIKSQLDSTSRVSTKNKIFRARVTGSVDSDTIHMTNIVM
jgi:hypothetical protein